MKNLSLLFLTLVALPLEAAQTGKSKRSNKEGAASSTATAPTSPTNTTKQQQSATLSNTAASIIADQPIASSEPALTTDTPTVKSYTYPSHPYGKYVYPSSKPTGQTPNTQSGTKDYEDDKGAGDVSRRIMNSFSSAPNSYKARFEDESCAKGTHSGAHSTHITALHANAVALQKVLRNPDKDTKDVVKRLEEIPYVRPTDEDFAFKEMFQPVVESFKIYEKTLPHLAQAKTKEDKSAIYKTMKALPELSEGVTTIKVRTRPFHEIVTFIDKKQTDPCATLTESSRTVSKCGQSIIEGSRISDIENIATNYASSNEEKAALLETKRRTEFAILLAQLESYTRARDLETTSQARLSDLEAKASQLEATLLNPGSEKERIETERALLTVNREKAGIIGQLKGAKKDRLRKNDAICVARTETGSLKASALAGLFGAKTASYTPNTFETPLMIEELFSKILPQLSQEERKRQAGAFLDILLGKKTTTPTRLTWTGQQSVKMTSYPEFSCIVDGKDLSGKPGTEREPLMVTLEPQSAVQKNTIPPCLIELYRHRAGHISDEMVTDLTTPTLEQLRKKPKKWSLNPQTKTWHPNTAEESYSAVPAAAALAALGGAASATPALTAPGQPS